MFVYSFKEGENASAFSTRAVLRGRSCTRFPLGARRGCCSALCRGRVPAGPRGLEPPAAEVSAHGKLVTSASFKAREAVQLPGMPGRWGFPAGGAERKAPRHGTGGCPARCSRRLWEPVGSSATPRRDCHARDMAGGPVGKRRPSARPSQDGGRPLRLPGGSGPAPPRRVCARTARGGGGLRAAPHLSAAGRHGARWPPAARGGGGDLRGSGGAGAAGGAGRAVRLRGEPVQHDLHVRVPRVPGELGLRGEGGGGTTGGGCRAGEATSRRPQLSGPHRSAGARPGTALLGPVVRSKAAAGAV